MTGEALLLNREDILDFLGLLHWEVASIWSLSSTSDLFLTLVRHVAPLNMNLLASSL
jgi:hypothetical protein